MDRRELFDRLALLGVSASYASPPARGHEPAKAGGAKFLAPVHAVHAHFCGIHLAKHNLKFQLIAQHYCAPRGEEMHQCLLYDSCAKDARLLGVEYIISDRLYRELPFGEKKYWHPHTYEVLAGGLIAPGMKPADEMRFMKSVLTTWGKTWHTWPDPTTSVPLGEPMLMWAATGDGQVKPAVLAARDKQFNVSAARLRAQRCRAIGMPVPQVAFPRTIDQVGRQWSDDGDDKPPSAN